jgi:hypothetical protein
MTFSDANALMTQKNRYTFERKAGEKQFHRKRVAETMSVPLRNFRELEKPFKAPLPLTDRAVQLGDSAPEIKTLASSRRSLKCSNDEIRQDAIDRHAGFLRIEKEPVVCDAIDAAANRVPYRNYIHPQKELSHGVSLTTPDAQILWEIGKSTSRQLLK